MSWSITRGTTFHGLRGTNHRLPPRDLTSNMTPEESAQATLDWWAREYLTEKPRYALQTDSGWLTIRTNWRTLISTCVSCKKEFTQIKRRGRKSRWRNTCSDTCDEAKKRRLTRERVRRHRERKRAADLQDVTQKIVLVKGSSEEDSDT